MAVKGVFASDAGLSGERAGDFASGILKVNPTGTAPLFALTSGMPSSAATDIIVNWFEENHITGRVNIDSFVTDGDGVGFNVDDASSYIAGAILLVEETGEYMFVDSVVANVVTCTRGMGGSTVATVTADDHFQRIGTGHEEGSSKPVAVANKGFPRFNYVQIFRNTWNVTRTAEAINYRTGSRKARSKADAGQFHAEDIERSFIWGIQHIGTLNGESFHAMDGVNNQIVTNITTAGGTTNWTQLQDFFLTIFSRNIQGAPNERIAFCGNGALNVINNIARLNADLNITVAQTDFGMNVSTLITPFGTVKLMTHPLMTENPVWTNELYIYHPAAIRTRYLRRTTIDDYDKDGTRAGVDADFGVWTTEVSIEYRAELTGGQLLGLTAAAVG